MLDILNFDMTDSDKSNPPANVSNSTANKTPKSVLIVSLSLTEVVIVLWFP